MRINALVRTAILAVFLTLGLASLAFPAEDRPGTFGFSVSIDGEGFFLNPTLKSITVDNVAPGSPAAVAGIVSKDRIVEVEGHQVAGIKANELKPYMKRSVGQVLHLRLRRASGEEYAVALTAVAKE